MTRDSSIPPGELRPSAAASSPEISRPRRRSCRSSSASRLSVVSLALLLGLLGTVVSAPAVRAASRYQDGDRIRFTGLVTDSEGQPIADVRVTLEVSRSYFSLRELRKAEKDIRRVSANTDSHGEYSLEWTWDGYFNRFRVVVAVPVRKGREETHHTLAEADVTQRAQAGSPVVASLVIADRKFLEKLRAFVASVRSADERRVYEEMGTPDDVKQTQVAGSNASLEATWWYYGSGAVYRFRDGHLEEVSHFDPVRGFPKQ